MTLKTATLKGYQDIEGVDMKTIARMTIIIAMMALIFLSGCGENKQTVKDVLEEQGVPFKNVELTADTITITYEASDATGYDGQIIGDWGMLMGAAAGFEYENIVIINTVNDVPLAKLTTTRKNVQDFTGGIVNESVFWSDVEIRAIK